MVFLARFQRIKPKTVRRSRMQNLAGSMAQYGAGVDAGRIRVFAIASSVVFQQGGHGDINWPSAYTSHINLVDITSRKLGNCSYCYMVMDPV